jgi:hypothetical protein
LEGLDVVDGLLKRHDPSSLTLTPDSYRERISTAVWPGRT